MQDARLNGDSLDQRAEDRKLVEAISQGSTTAWQNFVTIYSGIIYDVIRRHFFETEEDEILLVHVNVLKRLYDGDLARYENRSRLVTWLVVYTRARCVDHLRSRLGRYRVPEMVAGFSSFDRQVLQLYFVERLSLELVVHTMAWQKNGVSVDDVVDSIQRLEESLDRRYLRRLEEEFQALTTGASSVRMLKYLVRLRTEIEQNEAAPTPEQELIEQEAAERAARVRELVSGLPREERDVIMLRFEQRLSANKIAQKLRLERPRRVYTILDRVLKKLRVALNAE